MNRRTVILAPGALLLARCGGGAPTVSQIATDADLIASGIAAAVTEISAIPGVPSAKVATLQGYLATIQADARQIAASTVAPATSTVQEIAQAVNAIAPIALALVPGGSALVPVIEAATSMLPSLLAAVGVAGDTLAPPKYTASQARLILASAKR